MEENKTYYTQEEMNRLFASIEFEDEDYYNYFTKEEKNQFHDYQNGLTDELPEKVKNGILEAMEFIKKNGRGNL